MIVWNAELLHGDWHVPDALFRRTIDATVDEAGLPDSPPANRLGEAIFGTDYELSIALSDDAHVRELNRTWRGIDKATNVLSFPSEQIAVGEQPPGPILGDIVFALETCGREASEQGKTFDDHFTHLLVHGLLHLFGYDHIEPDEAERMEATERRVLRALGIADPYAHMDASPGD